MQEPRNRCALTVCAALALAMAGCGGGTSGGGSPSSSTYGISGTITDADGSAESGVSVSLTGAAERTTTTDPSGNYSFTGLANGDYTVMPTKSGYTCSPPSRSVTVGGGAQAGVNFTATAIGAGAGSMSSIAFFHADDGVHGCELWKTDGTEAGTVMVKDVNPGPTGASSGRQPWGRQVRDGVLYAALDDGIHGVQLWKTDGTEAGTAMMTNTSFSYPYLASITVLHGVPHFTEDQRLWRTDGTAVGTVMLGEAWQVLEFDDNILLFWNGADLWKTDGTIAGTVAVKQDVGFDFDGYKDRAGNAGNVFNGSFYFFNYDTGALWRTDGTSEGTVPVKEISHSCSGAPAGMCGSQTLGRLFAEMNGTAYFSSDGGVWKTDGTDAGTVMVKDFGGDSQGHGYPHYLTAFAGSIHFLVEDRANNTQLWRTDGSAGGTLLVTEIPADSHNLFMQNGALYTVTDSDDRDGALWKTDGTATGTTSVSGSLLVDAAYALPGQSDGPVFLIADDGTHGYELWKTDGTAAGTAMVKDINSGAGSAFHDYDCDMGPDT